jgi:hypothetical protein
LHHFDGFGPGSIGDGRSDGHVASALVSEVFESVALFHEEVETAAGVGAILCQDAGQLGQGRGAGVTEGNEGFLLALGEIGERQDWFFMFEGAQIVLPFPLVRVGKGSMQSGDWVEALF